MAQDVCYRMPFCPSEGVSCQVCTHFFSKRFTFKALSVKCSMVRSDEVLFFLKEGFFVF